MRNLRTIPLCRYFSLLVARISYYAFPFLSLRTCRRQAWQSQRLRLLHSVRNDGKEQVDISHTMQYHSRNTIHDFLSHSA